MAGSLNRVTLIGNIGKDPEIRNTQSGKKIANLTIATSESWNDRQSGERKERTEWHRVSVMSDALASVVERFLKKGSKVYVAGSLQTRKWTDNSGAERYTTEIILSGYGSELIMLDGKNSEPREDKREYEKPQQQAPEPTNDEIDDEIPF